MSYYTDPTLKSLKGTLQLQDCRRVIAGERCKCQWPAAANVDLMFGLEFAGNNRVFHWYTDEAATMGLWMEALAEALELGADAQIPEGRPYMGEKQTQAARARELEARRAKEAADAAEAARKVAEAEIAKLILERDAAMDAANTAKLAAAEEEKLRSASEAERVAENAKQSEAVKAAAAYAAAKVAAAEAVAKARVLGFQQKLSCEGYYWDSQCWWG
jgi:hypothetical protein